jgi:hypothetical protein
LETILHAFICPICKMLVRTSSNISLIVFVISSPNI